MLGMIAILTRSLLDRKRKEVVVVILYEGEWSLIHWGKEVKCHKVVINSKEVRNL